MQVGIHAKSFTNHGFSWNIQAYLNQKVSGDGDPQNLFA